MKIITRYRAIEFLRLMCDSILPIIFWISLIFGFDTPYIAILTIISAVIHELGHCAAIYCISGKGAKVRGHASGFRIRRTEARSYVDEITVLLSGPFANIAVCLLLFPFRSVDEGYIRTFMLVNLATGLSNLMPLEGYDGYGALAELLRAFGKPGLIHHIEAFSFILSTCVTFIALYLIERFGEGYWIFGLFFFTVLSKSVSFGKYDIFGE